MSTAFNKMNKQQGTASVAPEDAIAVPAPPTRDVALPSTSTGEAESHGGGVEGATAVPADDISRLEFLTVDEIAEMLRLDRKTIYGMVKRRKLPGVRRCGKSIRIHRPTVLQWFSADRRHDRRDIP